MNWEAILPPPTSAGRQHYLTAISKVDDQLVEIIDVEKVLAEIVPYNAKVSRDKLDDLTKDKNGKGGLGTWIRGATDTAKDKVLELVDKTKEALGLSPSTEEKKEGGSGKAEAAIATGAAAFAAKKLLDRNNPNAPVKINAATGETEELSGKEKKASKTAEKLNAKQEELKAQQAKAAETAKDLRAKADIAKAKFEAAEKNLKSTDRWSKARVSAAWEYKATNESYNKEDSAARSAERKAAKLEKKITKLDKKIATNAVNLAKDVTTRGAAMATKAAEAAAAATPQAALQPTPQAAPQSPAQPTAQTAKPVEVIKPAQVELLDNKGRVIADVTPPAKPAIEKPQAGSSIGSKIENFLNKYPKINFLSKILAPISAAAIITEGASQARASLDNNEQGTALMQGSGKIAEAAGALLSLPAYAIGSGVNDAMYIAKTITSGNPNAMSKSRAASILDSAIDTIPNTIHGGQEAYLLSKEISTLTPEQQVVFATLSQKAKAEGLDKITPLMLVQHVKQLDIKPSDTPAMAVAVKEQTQSLKN